MELKRGAHASPFPSTVTQCLQAAANVTRVVVMQLLQARHNDENYQSISPLSNAEYLMCGKKTDMKSSLVRHHYVPSSTIAHDPGQ